MQSKIQRQYLIGDSSQMFLTKKFKKGLFLAVTMIAGLQSVYADGLPAEPLLTQRWRDMIANHSAITNPALLTEENYTTFHVAFSPILNGQFLHFNAGLTVPVGLYQSLGLTFVGENDGDVIGAKSENGRIVTDPNDKSSNSNLFFMLTYAYNFWSRFSLGINLSFAYQTNFGDPRMGTGLDLGLTCRALHHAVLGDHILGIATQNLIAPQMKEDFTFLGSGNESEYAKNLRLTWLSYYLDHRIESTLDFNFKDFLSAAKNFNSGDGKDFAKKIEFDVNYKFGLWLMKMFRTFIHFGVGQDGMDFWGLALGVNLPGLNNGRDFEIMYQYDVMTEKENDATGHTFYARFDLGKHREEIYARKMARMASLSPNDLYNQGRKLYAEKNYWDAFFIFSKLYTEYPDFFKIDWVEHFRGACLEELDMREASIKNYEKVKADYPLSSAVPHSDLGIMRVAYRKGDFDKVSMQFAELSKPNVNDSLKGHAMYIMGQTLMQQNDLANALDMFQKIPDGHPDYIFAQHAMAVCQAKQDVELSNIVTTLENCVGAKPLTAAQQEVINRSYLFLGYIFFEENSLSKAIVALRMVPQTSPFAEDALLGQGWTSLKARQWSDCISAGQALYKITNKESLKCEGLLIESYGHLLLKEYVEALNLLKEASERIKNVKTPDQDSLNYVRMQNESDRMGHNNLAENVEYLSSSGETVTIIAQIDSLHTKHNEYIKKFDDFYKFSYDFNRTTFFSRNAETISEDIEYAYATVQKIVGQKGLLKETQKIGEQQKELDSELEKLKNEMEQMQQNEQNQ